MAMRKWTKGKNRDQILTLDLTTTMGRVSKAALRIYFKKNCVFVTMVNPRASSEKATITIIPSLTHY